MNRRELGDGREVLFNGRLITKETKVREFERYSFASESQTGALSPLPKNFTYRKISESCSLEGSGRPTDAYASRMISPYRDSLAANAPMYITPTLSQTVSVHSTLIPWEGIISNPFEWAFRFDWDALTKAVGSNNQLVHMHKLDSSRLNAMFYTQHLPPLMAAVATGPLGFQHLLSSIINGVDYRTKEGSSTYRQLTIFPRPAVISFLTSLPTEIVAVIRHKLRAAAVLDDNSDRVESLLELERGLSVDRFCTDEEIEPVLDRLENCDYDVAVVIVRYASRASRSQDSLLCQVTSIFATSSPYRRLHQQVVGLIKILVDAGASLTDFCFLLRGLPFSSLDSLIALEEGSILTWIQKKLLTKALGLGPLYSRGLFSWIISSLKRLYHSKTALGIWTELDSGVVHSELLLAFQMALRYSWEWAVELVHDTCCQLGYKTCYSQVDPRLDSVVMQACSDRAWSTACEAVKDVDITDKHGRDHEFPFRRNDPEVRKLIEGAVRVEDFTKIEELLHRDVPPQAVLQEALGVGRDRVAVWATTFGDDRGIMILLEGRHASAASLLLLRHSHCAEALQATNREFTVKTLEQILYQIRPHSRCRKFPCFLKAPRIETHQMTLRVLSYHAIYNDDVDLLVWLQSQGLVMGSIRSLEEHAERRVCRLYTGVSHGEKLLRSACSDDEETQLPSLLDTAIRYRRTKVLSYLLNRGLPNRNSEALLYAVTSKAPFDMIRLLLQAGPHRGMDVKAQYGSAALRHAIRNKHYELLRIIALACDIHGLERVVGVEEGCLDWLDPFGEAVLQSDCTAVKILLENGGDLNTVVAFDGLQKQAPRSDGYSVLWRMTPLLVAIDVGNCAMVQFLVDNGAKIDPQLTNGVMRTPLQRAAEVGNFDLVQFFIAKGAVIDSTLVYGGATALQLAAMSGHVGIAALLIQHGANVNHPPARGPGRTAFEAAAEWCRPDLMHLLVQNGAQLDLEMEEEVEVSFERDGMANSKEYVFYVWRTVRKTCTQYERALKFAEDRKEYASKTIVENIGRRLGIFMDNRPPQLQIEPFDHLV